MKTYLDVIQVTSRPPCKEPKDYFPTHLGKVKEHDIVPKPLPSQLFTALIPESNAVPP